MKLIFEIHLLVLSQPITQFEKYFQNKLTPVSRLNLLLLVIRKIELNYRILIFSVREYSLIMEQKYRKVYVAPIR